EVERAVLAAVRDFAPVSRATMPPSLLSHRVLAREGGGLAWEVEFDGVDVADEDGASASLGDAIVGEARARIAAVAEVEAVAAFAALLRPAADRDFSQSGAGVLDLDAAPLASWVSYAEGSGAAEAGAALPADVLSALRQSRAAVPGEKD